MKKRFTLLLFITLCLLAGLQASAQDSVKTGVAKQTNASNEKADNLKGKTIQHQSLANPSFEKLGSIEPGKMLKKQVKKNKRKHYK